MKPAEARLNRRLLKDRRAVERVDGNRAASVQLGGEDGEKEKTYSLCIAFTTALEKGAELVVALIAKDWRIIDRNMHDRDHTVNNWNGSHVQLADRPRGASSRTDPACTRHVITLNSSTSSNIQNSSAFQHGPRSYQI